MDSNEKINMHFDDYTRCASTEAYRAKFFKLLDAAITQLRGNPPPPQKKLTIPPAKGLLNGVL